MSLSRSTTMLILGLIASAWAACMVVIGLWLAIETPSFMFFTARSVVLIGISCIAAGNLVFMYMVADRIFPSLRESQFGWSVEMFTLAVVVVPLILGARFP